MTFINRHKAQAEAVVEETHAKFVSGSIMKHVIVMSLTASLGLIALFFVDLLDFYFISLLGENNLAAAVGYAGTLLFFTTSVSIGLSIAMGALVSKSLGAKDKHKAQEYGVAVSLFILATSIPITIGVWFGAEYLVALLGASGETLELAVRYLKIVVLGMPLMSFSMGLNSILRAMGDAKNSMMILLLASIVNGILDPILIFGFNLGLDGAAFATLCSRLAMFLGAIYFIGKGDFFAGVKYNFSKLWITLVPIVSIALPAILTNLATPIGNAYVTRAIAQFGDSAVAGMSMIGRISPVAFAVIFALSGAIGPIIGQNLGAKKCDRVKQTVVNSIQFSTLYILAISTVLFLFRNIIVDAFNLVGQARELGLLFLTILSWLFVFQAMVFVANAVFNNVGLAKKSTIINFLKATIFTMPFVYYGAQNYGASGVLYGQSIGSIFIGIIALWWCFRSINHVDKKA
ncbi:MATE family efflux transporter [Candidatus Gracilibacteria bacterium]|nr:MATE family efflux transporter [Candidatus Gracilibacteria bacterium]